jgi:hypothetical protein
MCVPTAINRPSRRPEALIIDALGMVCLVQGFDGF